MNATPTKPEASRLTKIMRLAVAATLVAVLVNCGGSSDTSTNRNRNSALDECTDNTDASGKSDADKTKDSNPLDNNQGIGNDCAPSETQKAICDTTWDAAAKTVTLCDMFHKFHITQFDSKGKKIGGGQDEIVDGGTSKVILSLNAKTVEFEFEISQKQTNGGNKKVATLSFKTNASLSTTFEYDVEKVTPVDTSSTTSVGGTTTTEATGGDAGTDSVDESTTTVEDTTTTTTEETTTTVEETTTTVEDTTTTEAPATTSTIEPVPEMLVAPDVCGFAWNAASRTITACRKFDRFVAAIYGKDGRYSTRIEAVDGTITVPQALIDADGFRFAHVEVAVERVDLNVELYLGDAWLDAPDPSNDASVTALLQDPENPLIFTDGDIYTASARSTVMGLAFSDGFLAIESGGKSYQNTKLIPIDSSGTTTWRAYLPDGFGIARFVASGVWVEPKDGQLPVVSFLYHDPLELISAQTVQVSEGTPQVGYEDLSDEFFSINGEDPCVDVSPVLVMTPQSPSGKNRIKMSLDADCASSNHFMGIVIAAHNNDSTWWDDMRLQYVHFSTTRYSTTIEETTYLPDGHYVILFGSFGYVSAVDYLVNGQGSLPDCADAHLKLDAATRTGTLEGCTGGKMQMPGVDIYNSEELNGYTFIPMENGKIDLSLAPYSGWFWVTAYNAGGIYSWTNEWTPFYACFSACDVPAAAGGFTMDTSRYSVDGSVVFDDKSCVNSDDWVEFSVWHRHKDGYAYEFNTLAFGGDPAFVPVNGPQLITETCWKNNGSAEVELVTTAMTAEITDTSPPAPANDNFANPVLLKANEWVSVSNVSATSEKGEYRLAGWQLHPREEASVWYTFTPDKTGFYELWGDDFAFFAQAQVFRGNSVDKLGFVTDTTCLVQIFVGDCLGDIGFGAQAGSTYRIRLTGYWIAPQGTMKMMVKEAGKGDGAGPAGSGPEDESTTTSAEDTTTSVDVTTTAADESTSTTGEPTTTVEETTTTEKATTTTAKPATTTTEESTTTVAATATTVDETTTTGPAGGSTSTTAAPGADQEKTAALNDFFDKAAEDSSTHENTKVVTGDGAGPAVEVRENTLTMEIPVVDLWATLEASGKSVSKADGLIIFTKKHRPVTVRRDAQSVQLPAGTDVNEVLIVAKGANGENVTAALEVKHTLKPLFERKTDSSGFPAWAWIVAAFVSVILVLAVAKSRNKETGAAGA